MFAPRWLVAVYFFPILASAGEPAAPLIGVRSEFAAADTLNTGDETSDDARECLALLSWPRTNFTVSLQAAEPGCGDYLVRFPSARPIGDATIDLVSIEWFAAKGDDKRVRTAPAVVVVHESGRRMTVGRLIARDFSAKGVHAFLLHLPGYGARRVPGFPKLEQVIPAMHAAIADVRRARDAVAALPVVDKSAIGLQGTSLGGFLTATVAGLDHAYNRVFIVLAGGDLPEVLFNGSRELAKARAKLAAAGITEAQVRDVAREVEPLRLAHRITPAETWLYNGRYDEVVPRRCSLALAKAANLPADHHIELAANHYSGIIYLPTMVDEMVKHMTQALAAQLAANDSPNVVGTLRVP